jgi:hypothetical protein
MRASRLVGTDQPRAPSVLFLKYDHINISVIRFKNRLYLATVMLGFNCVYNVPVNARKVRHIHALDLFLCVHFLL